MYFDAVYHLNNDKRYIPEFITTGLKGHMPGAY